MPNKFVLFSLVLMLILILNIKISKTYLSTVSEAMFSRED